MSKVRTAVEWVFGDITSPCENFSEISPRSRPRSRTRSRRVFGRRDFHLAAISAEISPLISARFWPRFSSRRDLGHKRAEISGEMKISAAKNAPRLVARSQRDENLGSQKRAEISPNLGGQKCGEISSEISAR